MKIFTHQPTASINPSSLVFPWLLIYGGTVGLSFGIGFLIVRGETLFALALALMAPFTVFFVRRPFIGVILWLLLMPLSSAFPSAGVVYWAIFRILIPLTLCMTLLPRLLKIGEHPTVRFGLPELCIVALALLIPVSVLLVSWNIRLAMIKYFDRMLLPFCMYFIIRLVPMQQRDLDVLEWTAFAMAVMQSLIGFLSWELPQVLPSAWHHLVGTRTAGSLVDPAVFTSLLVFCFGLLFQGAMKRKPGLTRTAFILACWLCVVSIFISLERGSWLGGVFVFIGLLFFYPKPVLKLTLAMLIVMGFVGATFFSRQISMVSVRFNEQRTMDHRKIILDAMGRMVSEKLILGWGYDNLDRNLPRYYRPVGNASLPYDFFQTSHNTYLTIFTELGLIGFVLFLYPTCSCLLRTSKVWRRLPKEGLNSRALIFAFWLAALQNFTVSNFMDMRFFPIGLTLWWMAMGFITQIIDSSTQAELASVSPNKGLSDSVPIYKNILLWR
jgi:O-antigen ligase